MAIYETQEVKDIIPESVRPVLWFMLQELDTPSPNHHFELSVTAVAGETRQKVLHTQKSTEYRREFNFRCPNPVDMSVCIVGFDSADWLMMLPP